VTPRPRYTEGSGKPVLQRNMETGQIAYEAYAGVVNWHGMEPWSRLSDMAREPWRAAAHTVIQKGWKEGA
jgi:hypothetical protein